MSENSDQLSAGSVYYTVSTGENNYQSPYDMSGQASLDLQVVDNPSPSPTSFQPDHSIPPNTAPPTTAMNVTKSLNNLEASKVRARLPYSKLTKENKTFDFYNSPNFPVSTSTLPRKRGMMPRLDSHMDSTLDEEFARELKNSLDIMAETESHSRPDFQDALSRADTEVKKRQSLLLSRHVGFVPSVNEEESVPTRRKSLIFSKDPKSEVVPTPSSDTIEMNKLFTVTDPISHSENTPLLHQNTGNMENEMEKTVEGHIHFPTRQGRKDANFLIIPPGATPADLLDVLLNKWNLPLPKIILSLPGSSQLSHSSRFRQVLKENLIRIAATTRAWFLTEGVNKGISAFVGSCLQSHAYKKFAKREQNHRDFVDYDTPVPVIGMVNPDNVYKGDSLMQNPSTSVTYSKDTSSLSFPDKHLLDVNHSHFFLLNNPNPHSSLDQWSSIEETVSNHLRLGKEPLPVVRIVLDNSLQVIDKVCQSVDKNVATVVISSNDLMRKIHNFIFKLTARDQKIGVKEQEEFPDSCRRYLKNELGPRSDEVVASIRIIIDKHNLVTMFDMNMTYGADLSKAIVVALLKSRKSTGKEKLKEALDLVIDWNRVDLAEQNIFTESLVWSDTDLFQHYFLILILNQIEFLELMLERNVIDHATFVEHNLERLYYVANARQHNNPLFTQLVELSTIDQCPKQHQSTIRARNKNSSPPNQSQLEEDTQKIPLAEIGKLIKYAMKHSFRNVYGESTLNGGEHEMIKEHPIDNLFIWAVLTQRWKMADILLNNTNSVIFNAVAAKALITGMHQRLKDVQVVSERDLGLLVEVASKFEMTAVGVMEEAYKRDKKQAHLILQEKNRFYDDNNCIEMAVTGRCMKFLSHPCVQSLLDEQWKKPLFRQNQLWKKLLAMIFPFLIFYLVKFSEPRPTSFFNYFQFYSSPSIKFVTHVIFFILYLILYSFVVLFQWFPSPNLNPCEWIFIFWSFTYVLEEVRQLFGGSGRLTKKLRAYFNDRWNQFDAAYTLFFILGTVLRLIPQVPLAFSRHIYASIGFILFFRLLQFLVIVKDSGPFVYMVFRMLKNLGSFLLLALIFLLAYGVASQAILYPDLSRTDPNSYLFALGNILFRPYFQVFGEFFLDHIAANALGNGSAPRFGNSEPEVYVSSNFFVYLFLVVWLILSNILLINIIIAKFNNTFVEIESNAAIYWKYKFFNSVKEFRDKPVLPPPFNLIVITHRAVKGLFLLCKTYRANNGVKNKNYCDDSCEERKILFEFEKKCVLASKFNLELTQERNLEERFTEMDERLKNTQHLLVSLKSKMDSLLMLNSHEGEQELLSLQGEHMGSM